MNKKTKWIYLTLFSVWICWFAKAESKISPNFLNPPNQIVAQAPGQEAPAAEATEGEGAAAPAAAAEGGENLNQTDIRKLLSTQPDPSVVLEPIDDPPAKPQAKPKPGPPRPPTVALPGKAKMGFSSRLQADALSMPEVAVIISNKQFFPARLRMREGVQTKLYFTSTDERPAAVVIEKLQVQRWVAKENEGPKTTSELDKAKWEVTKEVNKHTITEILISPVRGNYSYHDVISGAKGQIIVE
jgi:hypothetical protein